jgi:hypothetical protein
MTNVVRRSTGRAWHGRGWRSAGWFPGIAILFCGGLALFPAATTATAVAVDLRHPRILFYADSLAAVRMRAFSVNQPSFSKWYQYYDAKRSATNFASYWTDDMAALYLISGETKFADTAIRETMKRVRLGGESQSAMGRLNEVPLTYDWCYDRLTPAQAESIVAYCIRRLDTLPAPEIYFRAQDMRWQYALAIWGEAGDRNQFVDEKLQSCIDLAEDHVFPCLDAISSGGTTGYYPGVYFSNLMNFVDCLRLAADYRGPILQSSYWNNSPSYWMHRLRPDLSWMRVTGRLNTAEANKWGFMAYFATRMGDRHAQAAANLLSQVGGYDGENMLPVILWYNPGGAADPLEGMAHTFADEDYGYYLHRSGWNLGPSSTDIQIGFYNGPDVEPDHERTQNSFTVTRGGDDLLISAGHFYDSSDQHYLNYAARAVSRNTVLIYDPAESFGSEVPNDGGQVSTPDYARGHAMWPPCGGGVDWGIGYRGDGMLLPAHEGLVFGVRGSATAAYAPAKVTGVCRELRMPRENWIFLQDLVTLAKPGLPVRIIFHCIDKPSVDGTLEQMEGSAYGGIWRSTDTRVITVERGASAARIYPVYTSGGRTEVRIVGGASATNAPWRQNVRSAATLTYVADAHAQGYECWVDGANRSPTHGGLTQDQISNRNGEPHACGDWRVEILISDAPSVIRAVTAVEVGPRGMPVHLPGWTESRSTVMVRVTGTPDDFSVHLPPPACSE